MQFENILIEKKGISDETTCYIDYSCASELVIRYGGVVKGEKGHRVKVLVNGQVFNTSLLLPNSDHPGKKWSVVKVPIVIERGANRIRLEPLAGEGLCIDEILIR